MTDLLLRDIDPNLAARIRRVADANEWTMHETILHLIERGLYSSEGGALRFDGSESDVMQSAIAALETVPNDPGFSLIGRIESAGSEESPQHAAAPSPSETDLLRELDAAAARIDAAAKR